MTLREYNALLRYDLKGGGLMAMLRKKYFNPNTNIVYLCRKMWYYNTRGRLGRIVAKIYSRRILKKYNCYISPEAIIGKGFIVKHPIGITIGECKIGEDFVISQNCTVGDIMSQDKTKCLYPIIGNRVYIGANSVIQGNVVIEDETEIQPNSCLININL